MIKYFKTFILLYSVTVSLFAQASPEEKPWIGLNYNENPYGPFPSIKEAMTNALDRVSYYPDSIREKLTAKLAQRYGVQEDQIFVSNGLSSILFIIADAIATEGSKVIVADPTFDFFMECAENRGAQVVKVPLKKDYSHDLDAMLACVDDDTKVVLICNPNNPTGTLTPRNEIERFIALLPPHVYVIIDEAYHEFGEHAEGYVSFLQKPIQHDRVIVGRTFSKVYGLAGMRVGYVVSSKPIIDLLKHYSDIDRNNVAAMEGAIAGLEDSDALDDILNKYQHVRDEFYKQLKRRKIAYIPSCANFVMVHLGGRDAAEVKKFFKKHHILIGRPYDAMPEYIRISLGTPSQMKAFWKVWELLP